MLSPSSNGPETDFWGNPIECKTQGEVVPSPDPDIDDVEVRDEFAVTTVTLEVVAYGEAVPGPDGVKRRDYICLNFDVHVVGQIGGMNGQVMDPVAGGKPIVHPLPWDAQNRVTPSVWQMVMGYDKTKVSSAPYTIDLIATYQPIVWDKIPDVGPMTLACTIRVGNEIKASTKTPIVRGDSGTARCAVKDVLSL